MLGGVAILNNIVRGSLSNKVAYEKRLEEIKGPSSTEMWRRTFHAVGTASAKTLK